jgi:hypothetical protein
MPHFALGGFGAVFDFREQRRLNPDTAMRDLLGIWLGFAYQRLKARLQLGR